MAILDSAPVGKRGVGEREAGGGGRGTGAKLWNLAPIYLNELCSELPNLFSC